MVKVGRVKRFLFTHFKICPECGENVVFRHRKIFYFTSTTHISNYKQKTIQRAENCYHCIFCNTLFRYHAMDNNILYKVVGKPKLTEEQENILDSKEKAEFNKLRLKKIKRLIKRSKDGFL